MIPGYSEVKFGVKTQVGFCRNSAVLRVKKIFCWLNAVGALSAAFTPFKNHSGAGTSDEQTLSDVLLLRGAPCVFP